MRFWRMVNVVFLAFSLCRIVFTNDTNGSNAPRSRLSSLACDCWNIGTQGRVTIGAIPSGSTSIVGHLEPILLGFYPIAGWGLTIGQVHVLVSPTLWPLCSLLFSCHLQRLHARGSTMSDSRGGCNGLRGFGRWGKNPWDQVQEAEAQMRLKQGPHEMCSSRHVLPQMSISQETAPTNLTSGEKDCEPLRCRASRVMNQLSVHLLKSERNRIIKKCSHAIGSCLIGIHETVGNRICLTWNFLLIAVLAVSFIRCGHMKIVSEALTSRTWAPHLRLISWPQSWRVVIQCFCASVGCDRSYKFGGKSRPRLQKVKRNTCYRLQ